MIVGTLCFLTKSITAKSQTIKASTFAFLAFLINSSAFLISLLYIAELRVIYTLIFKSWHFLTNKGNSLTFIPDLALKLKSLTPKYTASAYFLQASREDQSLIGHINSGFFIILLIFL